MGAKVHGLQRDMAQTDETEDSAGEREKAEGQGPQSDDGKPEPVSESDDRCTDTGAVRMDKLLQTDGSQGNTGGAGRLDQTETALHGVGAVEETVDTFKDVTKSESEQGSRDDVSIQQPRSMVELGSQSSESGDKDSMVQGMGLISLVEKQRQFQR